jgi:hypothetical protein
MRAGNSLEQEEGLGTFRKTITILVSCRNNANAPRKLSVQRPVDGG